MLLLLLLLLLLLVLVVLLYHDGNAQNIDAIKPAQAKQGTKLSVGV